MPLGTMKVFPRTDPGLPYTSGQLGLKPFILRMGLSARVKIALEADSSLPMPTMYRRLLNDGANAGNGPIGRLHFVNDVFTGFKGQQFEIQPFSLVPSLFSGVPDQKRFMLAEPCRAKRHKGLGERCGAAQAPRDHKKQGQQTSKGIAHFHDFLIHP